MIPLARFALVREAPPVCGATAKKATSAPAVIIDLPPYATRRGQRVCWTWLRAGPRRSSGPGSPSGTSLGNKALRWWPRGGFTGFNSAAGEELPKARAVMGRRGRAGVRLYQARRTLRTGAGLLTDTRTRRLEALFADERRAPVRAAWGVYQRPVPGLQGRGPGPGKVPDATGHQLPEADRLRRARGDHDAGQDPDRKSLRHPWPTSTTPAPPTAPRQAINGCLEHLRGIALGFRNLASYTIRSLIHTGRLKDHLKATT